MRSSFVRWTGCEQPFHAGARRSLSERQASPSANGQQTHVNPTGPRRTRLPRSGLVQQALCGAPHNANYNSAGFYGRFFLTAEDKLEFLEQCVTWPCHGDPIFTYSDVERAVAARLRKSQIVAILSSQIAVERRRRELALLSELKARYEPVPEAPATAEIPDLFG